MNSAIKSAGIHKNDRKTQYKVIENQWHSLNLIAYITTFAYITTL